MRKLPLAMQIEDLSGLIREGETTKDYQARLDLRLRLVKEQFEAVPEIIKAKIRAQVAIANAAGEDQRQRDKETDSKFRHKKKKILGRSKETRI